MRFHLFRFLRWSGVRYRMLAHIDHRLMYFEDQTLMGEILEVLERRWYRRLIRWPWFGWEVEADDQEVVYYFWAPNVHIGDEIRKKILGKHPDMDITRMEHTDVDFSSCEFVAASSLRLDRDYMVPVKAFFNEIIDSQAPIVNAISDLKKGERVLLQVLVQPARNYQKDFDKALKVVKGWDIDEEREKIELFETNIHGKQNKQLGHTVIRVMAGARDKENANRIRSELARSFGQFKSEALNSFVPTEKWSHIKPLLIMQVKQRLFPIIERRRKRVILNIEELSGIVRLPSQNVNNSRLTRIVLRQIEAPPGVIKISQSARANGEGARYLKFGENAFRMRTTPVYLDLKTLSQHLSVLGAAGTGKTVFLTNFMKKLMDLKVKGYPVGFFLIDPLGGLAKDVASNIPKELLHLVNYVRPNSMDAEQFPMNVFDVDFATADHSIAKNIADAVGRIWPDGWGPRPAQNFLIGGMALQRIGEASIINLERLLRIPDYTIQVYKEIMKYPDLVELGAADFLGKLIIGGIPSALTTDRKHRIDLTDSTLNKLVNFTASNVLRGSMGAKSCGFRWLESMNEGKINILDLSDVQDDHEKRMIGSLALTMNYQAAQMRPSERENILYPLIVDEFPMFIEANAKVINEMADRTRQKNVPIIGASQGIVTQLDKKVADAIGRNFSTQIMFRLNHTEDANWMEEQFNDSRLTASDIKRTPSNYGYAKIGLGREPSLPFSFLSEAKNYKEYDASYVDGIIKQTMQRALAREAEAIKTIEEEHIVVDFVNDDTVQQLVAKANAGKKSNEQTTEKQDVKLTKPKKGKVKPELNKPSPNDGEPDFLNEFEDETAINVSDPASAADSAETLDKAANPNGALDHTWVLEFIDRTEQDGTPKPTLEKDISVESEPEQLPAEVSKEKKRSPSPIQKEEEEFDLTINFKAIGKTTEPDPPIEKDNSVEKSGGKEKGHGYTW